VNIVSCNHVNYQACIEIIDDVIIKPQSHRSRTNFSKYPVETSPCAQYTLIHICVTLIYRFNLEPHNISSRYYVLSYSLLVVQLILLAVSHLLITMFYY
jgi:hypothetical protein